MVAGSIPAFPIHNNVEKRERYNIIMSIASVEDTFDNGDWVCHIYSTYPSTDNMLGKVLYSDYEMVKVKWDTGDIGTYNVDELVRAFWV
jgi:hypothetical protein